MRIFNKIANIYHKSSSRRYLTYLRGKGVKIGSHISFFGGIRDKWIDLTRPSLIEIGDNVQLNRNFTLLTHDFVTGVFLNIYSDFVPSSGKVKIENNVGFGYDCTVLKGVTIGDNCFIGAGSIVSKSISPNSVAVGRPAKVVCTIVEYYRRRKVECIEEARLYAQSIKDRYGRMPEMADFLEEFPLFFNMNDVELREHMPLIKRQLGSHFEEFLINNRPIYKILKEFLVEALK